MKTKYTPGPWRVTKTTGEKPAIESDHDPHFSVAIVPRRGPEMFANARLIAAAPQLVEALRELVANCPITYDYHGDPLDPELGAALDNAEAALKAAGIGLKGE